MVKKINISTLVCILILVINVVGKDLPLVKPESMDMSSERLERIGTVVQRSIDDKRIAGAVTLVARRGQVVWFKAQGVMDITTNAPMQHDAIFRIGSMSKPLATVAMMILYEEGKFQLDDPVSKFIPELKGQKVFSDGDRETWAAPKREMTIQDLLRHTSGLTYGNYPPVTGIDMMLDAAKLDGSPTLKDMVLKLCGLPLLFSPGERWEYGWSTDVLGYVVQIISNKPFDVFLRERIFEPLRMTDTDFLVPKEKWPRFTSLHALSEQGDLVVTDMPANGKWSRKPTFLEPGGGLVSTAADYFRFTQMLLNRGELEGTRILSPKTVDMMTVNQLPVQAMPLSTKIPAIGWMVNGWGFGMGFRVLTDPVTAGSAASIGSFGWFGFHDTFFLIDPKEQLIGIFMAQFTPPPLYPGVREFQSLMFQAIVR